MVEPSLRRPERTADVENTEVSEWLCRDRANHSAGSVKTVEGVCRTYTAVNGLHCGIKRTPGSRGNPGAGNGQSRRNLDRSYAASAARKNVDIVGSKDHFSRTHRNIRECLANSCALEIHINHCVRESNCGVLFVMTERDVLRHSR